MSCDQDNASNWSGGDCRISDKISRRILSGDQGMIVWWSIGAGVHVEPHSHANEQSYGSNQSDNYRQVGIYAGLGNFETGTSLGRIYAPVPGSLDDRQITEPDAWHEGAALNIGPGPSPAAAGHFKPRKAD